MNEVYTNKATTEYRETKLANLRVIIRKPYCEIDTENVATLQFLDLIKEVLDISEVDGEELTNRLIIWKRRISSLKIWNRFCHIIRREFIKIWLSEIQPIYFDFWKSWNHIGVFLLLNIIEKCKNFKKIAFDHCKICPERFVIWKDNFSFIFQRKEDKEVSEKREKKSLSTDR